MLREQFSHSSHQPRQSLPKPTSQSDVMWSVYMDEVRANAFGDVIHPNELSPANTDKYAGLVTHPVESYEKDITYPHHELTKPNSNLIWCSITKK